MNKTKVEKIFAALQKNNSDPTTELQYKTHFELLVAVLLSAQATDISVNKATKELFKVANTPQKILDLSETGLKNYIKTIGLYNSKAANLIKTCQKLIKDYNSKVPSTREELESLPGVGRKTANVILNTAFGHATIAVDTHVLRVANRIGLAHATTPLAVEEQLEHIVPNEYKQNAHNWLILHGRYVCKARKPLCATCCIEEYCEFKDKNFES